MQRFTSHQWISISNLMIQLLPISSLYLKKSINRYVILLIDLRMMTFSHKNWCMAKVLGFLIRYFSNYYTLHRSDLAARAAPLDPRLQIFRIFLIRESCLPQKFLTLKNSILFCWRLRCKILSRLCLFVFNFLIILIVSFLHKAVRYPSYAVSVHSWDIHSTSTKARTLSERYLYTLDSSANRSKKLLKLYLFFSKVIEVYKEKNNDALQSVKINYFK